MTKEMKRRPLLTVFINSAWHRFTDVELLPDRYVSVNGNEPAPIEDFGDYHLTWE